VPAVVWAAVEYWWRYGSGPARSSGFADRTAAEDWLASAWSRLRDEGVDEVTLVADDDLADEAGGEVGEVVYGPMSLHPSD